MTVEIEEAPPVEEAPAERPPVHPLFIPQKEGDLDLDVRFFTVDREIEGRPREQTGKLWTPTELPDFDALVRRFGGGTYYLRARTARAVHVKGGSRVYFVNPDEHPPLPMTPPRARPAPAHAPPAATLPAPPAPPPAHAPGPDMGAIMSAVEAMQARAQAALEQAYAAAEKARAESSAQMLDLMKQTLAIRLENAGANAEDKFMSGMAFANKVRSEARTEVIAEMSEHAAKGESLEDTLRLVKEGAGALAMLSKGSG